MAKRVANRHKKLLETYNGTVDEFLKQTMRELEPTSLYEQLLNSKECKFCLFENPCFVHIVNFFHFENINI